jgi:6-phospho-beta-glucosidase
MSARVRLVILGGSSLSTPLLFEALAQQGAQAAYDVILFGRDTERLELVQRVSHALLAAHPALDLQLSTCTQLEEALEGADFCLNQIRPGGLAGRAFDETFPRELAPPIPGEETLGPGGFSSACRSVPAVLALGRLLERVAPEAVLLNLTNPCSLVQTALRRYTRVNVLGLCELPILVMERLSALLGAPRESLEFELSGLNHFSWITAIRQAGREVLPDVLARLEEAPRLGLSPAVACALGVIPSPLLRFYFHPEQALAEQQDRPVRAQELIALGDEMLADYRRWQPEAGALPATLRLRGAVWYEKIVAPVLLALAERRPSMLPLNIENLGAVPGLPGDAIVEVLAAITEGRVQPPAPVALPADVLALTARQCAYERLAAEAIAERDRSKALRALLANPWVHSHEQAERVLALTFDAEPTP